VQLFAHWLNASLFVSNYPDVFSTCHLVRGVHRVRFSCLHLGYGGWYITPVSELYLFAARMGHDLLVCRICWCYCLSSSNSSSSWIWLLHR